MSTPLPPPPRSPFWGACVFATDRGFTISGVGCMAQRTGLLDRALDLRSQTIQEDDEALWVCRPAYVGRERAKIIGRVAFAKDFAQRDGLSGAAAVVREERIVDAGYGGLLTTITALHERFLKLCLDDKTRQVTFGGEHDLLGRLPLIDTTEPLTVGEERPLRVKLPPTWSAYAGLSDIFLLMASHPDLSREVERRGFLLRVKASGGYDTELDSRLLARWLETVLGAHQEWGRQLAEANGREKALQADLAAAQAELSTMKSRAQELARARDEALLGELNAVRAGIAAKLDDLDCLVQTMEAERPAWSARAGGHAPAQSHPANLYPDPTDRIPRQTVGQPVRGLGWLGRWRPALISGLGVKLSLTAVVILLVLLLLIWLRPWPVETPYAGHISPQSGKQPVQESPRGPQSPAGVAEPAAAPRTPAGARRGP